jgi:hypothetical protein
VGQLVQDHGGVFDHVVALQERRRPRDVHLLRQPRIVASLGQPIDTWVVRTRFDIDPGMVVLDPDFQFLHLFEAFFRHQDGNALQVIGKHLQCDSALFGVLAIEQLRINVNGPTFDILDDGIEAGLRFRFFLSRNRIRPGNNQPDD